MSESRRILIIDDDMALLAGLHRQLGDRFDLEVAETGDKALALVEQKGPFAAVLCDMRMPGMDGVEVLRRLAAIAPDTVRMMLTGNADQKTAVEAINQGSIFRFFNKPTPAALLAEGFEAALRQYQLLTAERQLLEETLAGSVSLLADVLALVAPDSFHRSRRLQRWAKRLARHMKMPQSWVVEMAAGLANLGAIAIPPEVLSRHYAGHPLSPMEAQMIATIPATGAALIRKIPRLQPVADAVEFQAEPFNNPRGKTQIPLAARILNVLINLADQADENPSAEKLSLMSREVDRYDPAVLAAAQHCLLDFGDSVAAGTYSHLALPVAAIRAGDVLESDLLMESGRLVLASGQVITDIFFLRLQNLHQTGQMREPVRVRREARL